MPLLLLLRMQRQCTNNRRAEPIRHSGPDSFDMNGVLWEPTELGVEENAVHPTGSTLRWSRSGL